MAVRRVHAGERPSTVMRSYGLCRTTIYKWLRAAKRGGEKALQARKHPGRKPFLSPKQKLQVRRWINGKDPRQYGFDFGLWTRRIVAALIEERFGVRLGVTAIGRLLAALDITPQKPLRRAYERDPVAIERWKREEFPRLRTRAKRVGAKIFFLDEAGVRSDQVLGRTWGLRGQTPEVPTSGRRQSVSAISTVNARGAFWYEIYTERLNPLHRAIARVHARPQGPRVPRPRPPSRARRQGRRAVRPEPARPSGAALSPGLCARAQPGRVRLEPPQAPRREQEAVASR
jgi:transposase